jgi:hypothetical protein
MRPRKGFLNLCQLHLLQNVVTDLVQVTECVSGCDLFSVVAGTACDALVCHFPTIKATQLEDPYFDHKRTKKKKKDTYMYRL